MNQEEFINAIKIVVTKTANDSVIANLEKPPGRQPESSLIKASDWYNGLDIHQKEIIKHIVNSSVHHAIFGVLCVIDGVRSINNAVKEGAFKLSYIEDNIEYHLNNSEKEFLHDIYNNIADSI